MRAHYNYACAIAVRMLLLYSLCRRCDVLHGASSIHHHDQGPAVRGCAQQCWAQLAHAGVVYQRNDGRSGGDGLPLLAVQLLLDDTLTHAHHGLDALAKGQLQRGREGVEKLRASKGADE